MAIKFYLYSTDINNGGIEIHCNTNSTITEIAGTFDLGTMELKWNECKYAIFPNTPFFIVDTESNEQWNFIICQDNVEIVEKTNPIKYLHTLTLSQSIHKLNNVPLRNTVFTQPYDSQKKFKKGTFFVGKITYNEGQYYATQPDILLNHIYNEYSFLIDNYKINLSKAKKIKSGTFKITSIIVGNQSVSYDHTYKLIEVMYAQGKLINDGLNWISFRIVNANNTNDYIDKTVYSSDINKEISFTDADINWIKNKDIFIYVFGGALNELNSIVPSTFGSTTTSYPFICGLINVELNFEIYNYSLWDVLDIINQQCIKRYNGSYLPNYYEMPDKTTGQGLELDSIIAPEFNFTQMDLYEAVAKVLSFIDAFPIIKEGNILGYQYLNDLSDDVIENLQINDIKTTLNETNFTNKLASYYQNGRKNESITFPAKNFYRWSAPNKYGIPSRNDWYCYVNKPIDYIDSLVVLYNNPGCHIRACRYIDNSLIATSDEYSITFWDARFSNNPDFDGNMDIDILSTVYESNIYNNLPYDYASSNESNKNNCLYYSKGDNKIYLGVYDKIDSDSNSYEVLWYAITRAFYYNIGFGFDPGATTLTQIDKTRCKFNCVYHPILDGKVSQESISNKIEKETIVAQANSSTELNRLGNNLQGLIAKLGNEEKSITLPITKMKDRVKLGTHYLDELGNNWIVNKLKITFTTNPDKIIVEATFTKNYNAMQQFTSLNQEKRFYEISEQLTSKGYENINEFIYFTNNDSIIGSNLCERIAFKEGGLRVILDKTFNYAGSPTSDAYLENKNTTFDMVGIWTHQSASIYTKTYLQPVVYGNGNQICFEMSFDNAVAGGRYVDGNNNCNEWLYTESDGFADYVVIIGCFTDINTWYDTQWYPRITNDLPGTPFFELNDYYYYKKPNEIFHLNYSLNFLPYWTKTVDELGTPQYVYEEIFFGDKFINENGIIPNTQFENGKSRQFSLWVGNEKYSIIDQKAQGTKIDRTILLNSNITISATSSIGTAAYGTLSVLVQNEGWASTYDVSAYKSWCLADENGNIYIAVNRTANSSNETRLRWFTSRNRKT